MSPARRAALRAALLAALIAAAAGALARGPLRDAALTSWIDAEATALRYRARGPLAPDPRVIVVGIDAATVREAGRWPLPRGFLARAIEALAGGGAAAIGVDLLLADPGRDADGDAALAAALARHGDRTVLAVAPGPAEAAGDPAAIRALLEAASYRAVFSASGDGPGAPAPPGFIVPDPRIAGPARLGHVALDIDDTGALARQPLALAFGAARLPAMPLELARIVTGVPADAVAVAEGRGVLLGDRLAAAGPGLARGILRYGPAEAFPRVALEEVVDGPPPGLFADAVALIGVTGIAGAHDDLASPFGGREPGVATLAAAASNLLDGRRLRFGAAAWGAEAAGALLVALLASFALAARGAPAALAAAAGGLALWAAGSQALFAAEGVAASPLPPLLAAALVFALARAPLGRVRRRLEDGRLIHATALFVDLVDSTGHAERSGARGASARVAAFHRSVERAAAERGGRIAAHAGDGALLLFDDAAEALRCALALADAKDAGVRLGMHSGTMQLTRLGDAQDAPVTPIGDAVNLAARLQEVAKGEGARLVISEDAAAEVSGKGAAALLARFDELAPRQVRGRAAPVAPWALRRDRPAR